MTESIDKQLHDATGRIVILHTGINKTVLSRYNMRRVRFHTMRHLYLQPHLTLGELSTLTLVERASLSRMVYSMEKEGLVAREANEHDRRLFMLSLTDEGEALYRKVQADLDADIQKRFESLDTDTKSALLDMLLLFRDALKEHAENL